MMQHSQGNDEEVSSTLQDYSLHPCSQAPTQHFVACSTRIETYFLCGLDKTGQTYSNIDSGTIID